MSRNFRTGCLILIFFILSCDGSGSSPSKSNMSGSQGSGKPSPLPTPTPTPTHTFSTTFQAVENPISENGAFITSTTPGVNWSGLKLGGCGCKPVAPVAVTASGLAQSASYSNPNAGDALAVLTGSWGADQTASIVVANIPPTNNGSEEVEIHLRTDPATGRGYEITWGYGNGRRLSWFAYQVTRIWQKWLSRRDRGHDYILIVTWNGGGVMGAGAAYTVLVNNSGSQYAISPGDTLTASIQGNVIKMYRNGTMVIQYTDTNNSFTSGNPGFGFNEGATDSYGISSFSASSP